MKFSVLIFLAIGLVSVSAHGEQFEKCVPWLNYVYNYFYGSNNDSLIQADSLQADSATSNRTHIIKIETDSGDTMEYEIQEISDIGDPDEYSIDNPSLYYKDEIPYIRGLIECQGDLTELISIGVDTCSYWGNSLTANFPLSLLPQIDSLPSVLSVSAGAMVVDLKSRPIDPIKPYKLRNQSANDSVDVVTFIELYQHSYCIDTTGVEPLIDAMIFTNGNYSQLDSLGIDTGSRLGTTVVAWIPIALIRTINSLESVERIIFPSRVRPN